MLKIQSEEDSLASQKSGSEVPWADLVSLGKGEEERGGRVMLPCVGEILSGEREG
jgi:hypothetical protein